MERREKIGRMGKMRKKRLVVGGLLIVVGIILINIRSVSASTPGNINSCQVLDTPGVYNLTKNLENGEVNLSSSTIGCFNISSSNITLDCGGFYIRNTTLAKSGIYAGPNLVNITIRNCNVTMSSSGFGIYFNRVNNSVIENSITNNNAFGVYLSFSFNNTLFSTTSNYNSNSGIYLDSSNNNNFSTMTSNSNTYGVVIVASNNNNFSTMTSNSNTFGVYLCFSFNNTLFSTTSNYNSNSGIYLDSSNNNNFSTMTSNSNAYGIVLILSNNNTFFSITSNSNNYGSYLSFSLNNLFSSIISNSNAYGIYLLSSSNNNTFSSITLNSNHYGIYLSSSNNIFQGNNKFAHNLNLTLINSSFINENIERTYLQNNNISFNISVQYINKTSASNFNYSVSVYPNEPSLSVVNNSNNLAVTFNATKGGVYSVKINITLLDTNDTEIRNFIFLVGNTSLKSIRYYMHADEPTHRQPLALGGADSGSMFSYPTTIDETRTCSSWVQYSPDEIINQFFVIKNVSIGWFYTSSVQASSLIQRYVTYSESGDYSQTLPNSTSYVFNMTNFTNLNITSDYAWRFYWLSLKFFGGGPYVLSNSTQQSYADFDYIYAGPEILQLSENNGSDIRNFRLLSNVFNDNTQKNASLQLEGEGNFTVAVNMTNTTGTYYVLYDGVNCYDTPSNCKINSNANGIVNVSVKLD